MSASGSSLPRRAWLIVALLAPVALLNYLDRQMLASMKSSVMHDITDIETEANWGRMLGQFKWVYAFLSPIGGYVADRYGRRLTICGSLFAWSAVTWWTGHVTSYSELLWARTFMGISEAFYIPAALALIADYHTGTTRSRAVGVHQMGIYCGVILGGFSGYVADIDRGSWRWAFDACGLAGILLTIPLLLFLRDADRSSVSAAPSTSPLSAARALFSNGSFILLVLYFTLPALAGWVVRDWMPAILKKEFSLGQGKAGVSASLYWQCAAIVGALIGGWLADRWMRHSQRGRINVSALGLVVLIVPAIYGVGYGLKSQQLGMVIAFLILFGLGWGFFDGNNMPILCQIARPELRATGYGIMNMVSISAGGLADWGFGALQDAKVPLFGTFSIFAGGALLSVVLVLLIQPRPTEPDSLGQ